MGSNDSKEDDCVDRSSDRESKDDSRNKRKDQSSRPLKSKIIDPRVIRPDDQSGPQGQASEEEQGRRKLPI